MSKHHIIISGTGRAGTTFLVQLFTALGLETGFTDPTSGMYPNCDAGMEWDIRDPNAPYIIKRPSLCDYLDDVLENEDLIIDHALIPVRDLYSAAESRRDVTRRADAALFPGVIPGGLWHTEIPQHQEAALANQLYKIIYTISKRDIPMTLLFFPRFIHDSEYLYGKIEFMLNGIGYPMFLEMFKQTAQPELVHDYRQESMAATSTTTESIDAEKK
jgi:hypothetical protein